MVYFVWYTDILRYRWLGYKCSHAPPDLYSGVAKLCGWARVGCGLSGGVDDLGCVAESIAVRGVIERKTEGLRPS